MKKKLYGILIISMLVLSIVFSLYRGYNYLYIDIPLGYDPGLYRALFLEYFNNLPNIDFSNLSPRTKSAYPPFLGFLGNVLMVVGFKVDFLLSFGLVFFSVITSIFIYSYLKKNSKVTAIFGIIIFGISIIQYQSFYMNYYKQIIGIIFMLTSLYLFEKKKFLLSLPIVISLFTIHRPTGLYFLLLYFLYKILNIKKDKKFNDFYVIAGAGLVAFLMYLPFLNELIIPLLNPLFQTFGETGLSGTFFDKHEFWVNNFMVIIASLYGLYIKINKKDFDYMTVGYILGMIWVGFGLFFYSRFSIFYDLFIILVAAYGFGILYEQNKRFLLIFILFFGIQSYNYLYYVNANSESYIGSQEFEKLNELNEILPKDSIVMVSHKNYSPRLFGYSHFPIIAPGLFEYDIWTVDDWYKWWGGDGKVKCEMMKDFDIYNKELYLWLGNDQQTENLDGADCFDIIYKNGDNMILKYR